ncbi:MAG: hypothetical protein AAF682_02135 [Planctomycetota bacterium]
MHIRRPVFRLSFGALAVIAAVVAANDSEWPPLADPHWDGTAVVNNPTPGSPLYLDRIEFTIPNDPPYFYADWIGVWHDVPSPAECNQQTGSTQYGGFKTDFAIGDVDNDGEADDIIITTAGEAVFAAEMDIDWSTSTGVLNPHWLWLSPFAQSISKVDPVSGGLKPDHQQGTPGDLTDDIYSCFAANRNNPLIWNFVPDGAADDTNEIAFVGIDANNERQHLYLLRTDPTAPDGVQVVDSTEGEPFPLDLWIEHRLGICKVRNTEFPRDIVMTQHGNGIPFIWSYGNVGGTDKLFFQYSGNHFLSSSELTAKVHECNWTDLDGDGFDEFIVNGVLDFVDADAAGNPVALNGTDGTARWQMMITEPDGTGGGAHADQAYIGDWDPLRPGLEILAVTELPSGGGPWVGPNIGDYHPKALDTLWDADCGELIDEWDAAPNSDGQTIYGGNWTASYAGLEAISSPKSNITPGSTDIVNPPGQGNGSGSYARGIRVTSDPLDDDFELLAIDGALFDGAWAYDVNNTLKIRSGGPWGRVYGMDWDGDYATDEILNHPRNDGYFMVFRMGEKGDWGAGPLPPGMPDQPTVSSGTPPIQGEGDDPACVGPNGWWYYYYQGECGNQPTWNWNDGGPGLGSHYYEKLKEVFPNLGVGAIVAKPYDLPGSDHREEIIAVSVQAVPTIHVYFDSGPLQAGLVRRPSPHNSLAYRANRQTQPIHPFDFRNDAVAIQRLGVRPSNPGLPSRVVGIPLGGSVQLEAFLEFENGTQIDVSNLVTWKQDADVPVGSLDVSATGLVTEAGGVPLSGRFHAEMTLEGELRISEPTYVFATDDPTPQILRAGYLDSWLVDDPQQDDRPLRVEAWVGQRDNGPFVVFGQELDGTAWAGLQLQDNGIGPDAEAGDGIFSGELGSPAGLALGSNLKAIRAMSGALSIDTSGVISGQLNSTPWPFVALGGAATPPPWPNVPPPVALFTEDVVYEAPRIRSLGYRGWGAPGEILLEVEVEPSPLHPAVPTTVYVYMPGVGYLPLIDRGGGFHTIRFTGVTATGLFLFNTATLILDDGQLFMGDHAPHAFLHQAPGWDVDEPAPPLGFCLEPVGW